jgi:osmotically-inducible protein OsmY
MRGDERYQDQPQRGESRSMTTQRASGGQDWTGYVQPYRYYGPGYRGVGYYAVFYQGQDDGQGDDAETSGEQAQPETQFDQRNVHYGQGQGTGAGWQGRGRGGRGRQSGQFAGRGPKGYQRSDDRIREDVSDRLTEHGDLDASGIEVDVNGGVVTLSGTVDDRWGKRLAEDIVERVPGVRDVMNQLRVGDQAGQEDRSSGDMAGTTTDSSSKSQGRNGRRAATTPSR